MNLAVDADAMIKLTKASAKEAVAKHFTMILPALVREECVDEGKVGGFADAFRIEENLRRGVITAGRSKRSPRTERVIRELGLKRGEADALRLYEAGGVDLVVSDDRRFIAILDGLGVPFTTPSALVVALVRRGKASPAEGLRSLEKLAPLVSEAEYSETRRALEEE